MLCPTNFDIFIGEPFASFFLNAGSWFMASKPGAAIAIGDFPNTYFRVVSSVLPNTGEIHIRGGTNELIQITSNVTNVFQVDTASNMTMNVIPGKTFTISGNGGGLTINAAGIIQIFSSGHASAVVAYKAANAANWAGAPPADMDKALDRLAAAVAGLLGAPIP